MLAYLHNNQLAFFVGVFLVALLVRLSYALVTGALWAPEVWEYETLAYNMVQGKGFVFEYMRTEYRSFCEPLYPFISAVVYIVFGHEQMHMAIAQVAMGAATCIVAMLCVRYVLDNFIVAIIAGLVVALHPGLIFYTTKLHPLGLDALFFLLVLWSVLRYASDPSERHLVVSALLCGVCTLTRPTILFAMPVLVWWVWTESDGGGRHRLIRVLVLLGLVGAISGAWAGRNYAIHGEVMVTRSNTPFVFWLGNNSDATGSAIDSRGRDVFFDIAPAEFRDAVLAAADEITQNQMFAIAAIDYVKGDPWGFVSRFLAKFYAFWWFGPQAGFTINATWFMLYKVWWALLLCAAVVGGGHLLRLGDRQRRIGLLIMGIALSISTVQSIFYVEGRHRLAVEPLLSVLIATGLVYAVNKIVIKRSAISEKR